MKNKAKTAKGFWQTLNDNQGGESNPPHTVILDNNDYQDFGKMNFPKLLFPGWPRGTVHFFWQWVGLLCLAAGPSLAQTPDTVLLRLRVEAGAHDRLNTVVSVATELPLPEPERLQLYEQTGKTRQPIDFQLTRGQVNRLAFGLAGRTPARKVRQFVLVKSPARPLVPAMQLVPQPGGMVLQQGPRPLLRYNHAVAEVPPGVDTLFRRSGYLHPLWSPGGQVLTRTQPPDHYHHYGLWNPWTKTEVEGREVDFWNLYKGQGKVKFVGYEGFETGNVFAGLRALQQHVVIGPDKSEKVAIHEVWQLKAYRAEGVGLLDFTSELSNALPTPVVLKAYTYGGGIGWRATEQWHANNCQLLTSEGKDRATANGSKARWCLVQGQTQAAEGQSGVLLLCHPSNREYPQPLRIWGADFNQKRENMFVNFTPTQFKDWTLAPGQTYAQTYRLVVFDGTLTAAQAEAYWVDFAHPPRVEVEAVGR
jgi:hypothetical protein